MSMYNKEKNELHIYGCSDCPFSFETPRADANCTLNKKLLWYTGLPDNFPEDCPLRDPNFKIVRHLD